MSSQGQFSLLKQRRFGPYFATQFLGAFNDNVFKNALIILIAFQSAELSANDTSTLINLSAGLFILPFFLFSATAGQLADKFEKSVMIQRIKLGEIFIMLLATLGFYLRDVTLLMATLFLMGAQSSLFGPLKYGILPQQLREHELTGGNGLVEMGTFVAILLGNIAGERLIGIEQLGSMLVCVALLSVACLGYLASRAIPTAPPTAPELRINWNPITGTWLGMRFATGNLAVFNSILGVSWFWFLGATYLAQLPNYTRFHLGGDPGVYTLLLATFSIGIGGGSLLCEKLSAGRIEIGLVPLGAIGLTAFGVDLFFAGDLVPDGELHGVIAFLKQAAAWHTLVDVLALGVFGGFYIVPLYALIQSRSEASHRSRVIASNNILNACFMVASAVIAIGLLRAGLSIPQLFLVVAIMNAAVAIYIFRLVPEFLMRFLVWLLIHTVYSVQKDGLDKIPEQGAALLVCNHVSFVDPLVIAGCIRRPIRFVMYYKIFQLPILNFVFRTAGAIPIAGRKEDPHLLERAYESIDAALNNGELVCIFPEGQITRDGKLNEFRPGVEKILARTPVPVVPMALRGLWGSIFSRKYGAALRRFPRRIGFKIWLVASEPLAANEVNTAGLQDAVLKLRGELH
ncbi:MAG: MFS transporter [Gammaproteobacteria bacterium]|nr:MFS transporter [Gammaproteobacteria bacterium]